MSSSGLPGRRVEAMRAGAENYLVKPLDVNAVLVVLEKALERQNMPCRAFGSAREVLSELERDQPQVLVSDIRMAGLDGIELTHQVLLNDGGPARVGARLPFRDAAAVGR